MSTKLLTLGVVLAIVIAGLALFKSPVSQLVGSATNCTDGYTCYTNLEVQGNLITDGTSSSVGTTTFSNTLNLDKSTLCVNFYATSTATRLKLVASTTPTLPNGAAAVMVAQYGSCAG